MDVVEAGRERAPLSRRWLVAGTALLVALAAGGTWRAVETKPVARHRPAPSPSVSVPPLETIDPDDIRPIPGGPPPIQAQTPYEGAGVRMLLVSERSVDGATTVDDVLEPIVDVGPANAIRSTVRVGDGVAAMLQPAEFDEPPGDSVLVVHAGAFEARYPLPGLQRVVPGEDDDEFWTVDWLGTRAQRRNAQGSAVGKPVRLPAQAALIQVLRGGLMLMTLERFEPGIRVWDPARGRYARTIAENAAVVAATADAVAWTRFCTGPSCAPRVTDVATGRTRAVPVPVDGGSLAGAALDPAGRTLAFQWSSPDGSMSVCVADASSPDVVEVVANEVHGMVSLAWAGPDLVLAESLNGATGTYVWQRGEGLRGGPMFTTGETTAVYASAVT